MTGGPAEWLDDDERARAGRFTFERDRRRFVARRVFLRRVLGGYLGVAPAAVGYRTVGTGRPELDPACGLSFSTSHSGDLAVVAVSRDRVVGVDIEAVRPIGDALDLARAFFTAREADALAATPFDRRSTAFLRLWTCKEAYVKAVGLGMTLAFSDFDVLGRFPDRPPVLEPLAGGPPVVLASLDAFDGFIGAVATSATAMAS
jgi:4'-phosphopantetheinyl transferase